MHDANDDEQPAGESAAGRRAALALLIEAYQRPVGSYLHHLLGEPEVALALTRETFVCAYRERVAGQPGGAVRAWLYRAATRLAYRHLRRRRRPEGGAGGPARGAGRPLRAPIVAASDERALVQAVLHDLRLGERAVLLLCDLEQLPHDEAAAILRLSPERLGARLAQARAHFRRAYRAHDRLVHPVANGHPPT